MNYNMLTEAMEAVVMPEGIEEMSVYRACEQVPDGRAKRGVRYSVALILTLIVLAKLAGMTSPTAIAEWVRHRGPWLKQVLPCPRCSFPCAATYSNVLQKLDAEQVNQVLSQFLSRVAATARCADEPSRLLGQAEAGVHEHVALDGKTLRGTQGHQAPDQAKIHQVALYEPQTGLVLKEAVVGDKQNELSIASQFLSLQWVKGRIITADALYTQRDFSRQVCRLGGAYVLIAKDNQPSLREDLELFFREPPPDCRDWRLAHTIDKGHGRLERRELVATTELNAFLGRDWAEVSQVFRLTRRVQEQGQSREETVSGLTCLSPQQADAARLLALVREHWAIENRLHWRRDVTLREDASQVRKGQAPRVLAVLNSFLLALLDFLGVSNVPKQMRFFDAFPAYAVHLLLGDLLTFQ